MSESAKYDAQMKKLEGLCEEHDLTFRFNHNSYPITLVIRPAQGMGQQLSMLENADSRDYISPDASMVIYRKDGELAMKISGTFTLPESLRSKLKNLYIKLSDFWLQYFHRDIMQRHSLSGAAMPVIDENEADDSDEGDEGFEEVEPSESADQEDEATEPDEDLITAGTLLVRQENKASMRMLQQRLNIGYSAAARLMDVLEQRGVVGPYRGAEPREVLPADVPED